jgi:hypothetical protein
VNAKRENIHRVTKDISLIGALSVSNKSSIVSNIETDGSGIGAIRNDFTQDTWEAGITLQLNNLTTIRPFQSSKPVLDTLSRSGHKTLIVPTQPYNTTTEPVGSTEWLKRTSNWKDATQAETPPLYCADGPVENRNMTGTPLPHEPRGSGRGSDTVIWFTPQDYIKTSSLPGGRPDEVLLHEMVHALRMEMGLNLCLAMDDGFDTVEEFYAILIANIYRSECGYRDLRANHNGKQMLAAPLTDDSRFYKQWKDKIDRLCREMSALCNVLAAVPCAFNPIRRSKAAK